MDMSSVQAFAETTAGIIVNIITLAISIVVIVAQAKMFKKAGKHPLLAIIPIVDFFVLVDIVTDGKWYKGFWVLVPIADIVFIVKFSLRLAKCYGYGTGMGIANIFFSAICTLIMGFSKNEFKYVEG